MGIQVTYVVWLSACIRASLLSTSNPPSQKTTLIKPR